MGVGLVLLQDVERSIYNCDVAGKVRRYVLLLPRYALNPYMLPGTVIRGNCKPAASAHAQFYLQTTQSGKARLGFVTNCRTDMI
jgi:hypothetical protein